MGFSLLPLPPLSRAVCLKWYLFLFVTAHRDCCLDIVPSWHPNRSDTDAFGQKSEPVCSTAPCSHGARSASRAPSALLGKWSEHVGPSEPRPERRRSPRPSSCPFSALSVHIHMALFIFISPLPFLSLFPLPVRGLVSCFSPHCWVLGELGFCELEKERTSVWSALISVGKDLMGPGFWDHYLSFTFIKSVMRKFKIKGFVNWIPVLKKNTDEEIRA